MTLKRYVGMDLGGTNARAAVVDEGGHLLSVVKKKVLDARPQEVAKTLREAVTLAVAEAPGPVAGYGIGVPGQVKGDGGLIAVAPNLGWREVEFGRILSEALGHSVRVVNDLAAAAFGEVRAGAARGAQHVWVLFVGSGVGSAIIANGQPMRGAFGVAGEFGHVKVVRDGRRCGCGEFGCLEAYAGGHNLVAQMKERLSKGEASLLADRVQSDFSRLGAGLLEECALRGDAVAKEIYETARHHLGLAVANQVTVLNPSHLILGGGVLENCPHLRKSLAEDISKYASHVSREGLVVTTSGLGDNSGLVGAGLLGAGT